MKESSTHRGWVTVALLLAMFMTAIEITIVSTAMPKIVAELGGFSLLSWVFSAYLLTQVVCIPIYGKLADLYGRKPVFLAGVTLFLVASVLCGMATTMFQLIIFRFLQGIGGGAVQPTAVTIIGDLFKPHERHKIQGWIGSVFAISSLVGPAMGAFIVEIGHWPWIFYLNIPLGGFAMLLIFLYLKEESRTRNHKIDYGGAVLLVVTTSVLMLALLEGGTGWPWISWQTLACVVSFLILGSALIKVESNVKEPILPLWIFQRKLMSISGAATFLVGALMIGYSAMIPTHIQGYLGYSALVGGLALGAMSIGWPLASFFSGKIMAAFGFRKSAMLGALALVIGSSGILIFSEQSPWAIAASVFVVGMGLGLQSNAYIITIQSNVLWNERGVATANNLFMRTLGSSVGVAAFGGILNSTIASNIRNSHISLKSGHGVDLVNELLSASDSLSKTDRTAIIEALGSGMTSVFMAATFAACACLVVTFFLPRDVESKNMSQPDDVLTAPH